MTLPGESPGAGAFADPGLAAERTRIAWARSALALATAAAVVSRRVHELSAVTAYALLGAVAALVAVVPLAMRRRLRAARERPEVELRRLRLAHAATGAALVGVVCVAVVAAGAL